MENKLFNLDSLKKISNGSEEFIKKMLQLFINHCPNQAQEIKTHYNDGNLIEMSKVAHSLKPTIDQLGIESLKAPIREVEKLGKEENKSIQLQQLVNLIEKHINTVAEEFKSMI